MEQSVRVLGLALALAAASGVHSSRARACSRAAPETYAIDPTLRASDVTAPTPFTAISAEVTRTPGEVCRDGECTNSSCGAFGTVLLRFARPRDDRADRLGYRLLWLRGAAPASLASELNTVRPLSESFATQDEGIIGLTISFGEAETIDGEIALVAIDRAGNQSAPSEPVQLTFSGCTRSFEDDQCLEAAGCTITRPGRPASAPWCVLGVAAFALGAVGLRLGRARR